MIKVEIKPVYNDDGRSRAHQSKFAIPNYLEKTITVAGFTVYRKRVIPIIDPRENGNYELIRNC